MVKYGRRSSASRVRRLQRLARSYLPKARVFGSVVAGRRSRADPSCVMMVSIDPRTAQNAHVLAFQAIAAAHVPGYNSWATLSVVVLSRQDLITMLNNLLSAPVVQVTNFTGIKLSASVLSTPIAVFYRPSAGNPHQVVSGVGSLKFAKRFVRDPVSGNSILPDRIILAAGSPVSFKIRVYYTLKPARPLV